MTDDFKPAINATAWPGSRNLKLTDSAGPEGRKCLAGGVSPRSTAIYINKP